MSKVGIQILDNRRAIVQTHIAPHLWAGGGDAGEIAKARARHGEFIIAQRIVSDMVHQRVGEHMRDV